MKKLISIIAALCIIFTATNVFTAVYDHGCARIQDKIIENVLIAERVGQNRKMNGSAHIAAAQMAMFWLELFKIKSCGLLDESANIDSLTDGLIKAMGE